MQDNFNLNVMHIHHQLFDVPANLQRQAASQVHQPRLQVGLNLTEDGQSFCEYQCCKSNSLSAQLNRYQLTILQV